MSRRLVGHFDTENFADEVEGYAEGSKIQKIYKLNTYSKIKK